MKGKLNTTLIMASLISLVIICLSIVASAGQVMIKYHYDKNFEYGMIAKAPTVYNDGKVIARAEAIRKITTTTPYQIEVRETQYDNDGSVVYEGILVISLR